MQTYEYKVVPAPNRPKRVKGVKGTAGRFAALLSETMNEQAADGWEYLRSDSMPVEEKPGLLKSRIETYQTVLVFRRTLAGASETPMAGFIEDHSETAPVAEEPTASEPTTEEPEQSAEPDLPAEPTLATTWEEDTEYPADPPLTGQSDDSPFSHPENTDSDPVNR